MSSYENDDETRPIEVVRPNPLKANDLEAIELADEALINQNSRALDKIEANFDRQRRNRKRRAAQLQEEIEELKEKTRRLELGLSITPRSTSAARGLTPRESLIAAERELMGEAPVTRGRDLAADLAELIAPPDLPATTTTSTGVGASTDKTNYLEKLSATMEQEIKEIRAELNSLKHIGVGASARSGEAVTPASSARANLGDQTVIAVNAPTNPIAPQATATPITWPPVSAAPASAQVAITVPAEPSAAPVAGVDVLAVTPTASTSELEARATDSSQSPVTAPLDSRMQQYLNTPIVEELKAQDGLTSVISTKEANYIPGQVNAFSAGQQKWAEKLVKQFQHRLRELDKWDARVDELVTAAATRGDKKGVGTEATARFQTEAVRNVQAFRTLLGNANETHAELATALSDNNAVVFGEKLTKLNSQVIDLSTRYNQIVEAVSEITEKDKTRYALRVTKRVAEARKRNTDLINMMMFYIKHISPVLEKARVDEQTRTMELAVPSEGDAAPMKAKRKASATTDWSAKSTELGRLVYAWDNLKQRFNASQVALRNAVDHSDHKRFLKAQQELSRYETLTADFWDSKRWNEIARELRALGVKGIVRKVDTKVWLWLLIGAAASAIAGTTLGALAGAGILTG